MNGQHLRARPSQEVTQFIGDRWKASDLFIVSAGPFVDVSYHWLGNCQENQAWLCLVALENMPPHYMLQQ
ncbi:hypothetical protein S83_070702 [Arachis hypogaea]